MADDILSQEEVDALLRGVSGDASEESKVVETGGVRSYDIGRQERIVRGRMPTLELINERFTRLFRLGLFNLMRRTAEIAGGGVKVQKYSDFIRNLVVPTNLNIVHIKPLRGMALVVIEPGLAFQVVDTLFGGTGKVHMRVEGRDFTNTEQRIIRRVLDVVFKEYQKAWASVHQIEFEFVRSEMNTRFANIVPATDMVIVSTFNVDLSPGGGDVHICIPYAMLEPIREVIYGGMQTDREEGGDHRWLELLSGQVRDTQVELTANLAHASMTVRDLLALQPGDVIDIELPETVVGEVHGYPMLECEYGLTDGRFALKVQRRLRGDEAPRTQQEH